MTAGREEIERELERSNRELRTFRRLSKISLSTPSGLSVLGTLLEVICEATGFPLAALELYDPAREAMTLVAHRGLAATACATPESPAAGSLSGRVARSGEAAVESAPEPAPRPLGTRRFEARTFVCVPIKVEGRVLGTLSLGSPEDVETDERFVEWVADVAGHVGAITERKRTAQVLQENAARLRLLIGQMPALLWTTDADLRFTSSAGAGLTGLGLQPDGVDGRLMMEFGDVSTAVAAHRRALNGESVGFEGTFRRRTFEAHVEPLRDGAGRIAGCIGVALDVTGSRQAERELRKVNDTLTALVEASPLAIVTLDAESRVTLWSPAAERTFGWTAEEVVGKPYPLPEDKRDEHVALRQRLLAGDHLTGLEIRRQDKAGAPIDLRLSAAAFCDGRERTHSIAAFLEDISDRKRAEQAIRQLQREVLYDRVTELPNRAAFLGRLGERIEQGGAPFAVLSLNLDRFKVVNDSLGPRAGDQLLAGIARRISACLAEGDTAARLGSDEFAVLLRETPDLTGALGLAQSLREAIGLPLQFAGQELVPSVSIGLADGEGYLDAESLLRDAHIAMYRAKALGGGRCETFDRAMGRRSLDRLRLENELRRAADRGELELHYQPVVRLEDGALVAFEALMRWPHPERGMISPAEFIPIAEESGLILPLSYWALGQVCDRLREWGDSGPAVHLNVSSRLFSDPSLAERIRSALADSGADGGRLVLEITESVLMQSFDLAVDTLLHLKTLGVGVSIDDFGTGYSSLSYLQRLPVDSLKIDRSFVAKLDGHGTNQEIPRAILALARGLGLEVIAEGVETGEQLDQLLELGCGLAQGYLFSRPVDREAARELLAGPPAWARLPAQPAALPANVTPLHRAVAS